jgi:hypothetical protein
MQRTPVKQQDIKQARVVVVEGEEKMEERWWLQGGLTLRGKLLPKLRREINILKRKMIAASICLICVLMQS